MKISMGFVFISLLVLLGCSKRMSESQSPPSIDPALQEKLSSWLEVNGETPEDYVVGLFSNHDVVFLGEYHRIKHDVLFVQSLLEPLHEAGVHALATEFGRREDQPKIDSLLSGSEWDEKLAREIVFQQFVFWGYHEYVDIYKSALQLNRRLSDDVPPFRILGINDSPDWSLISSNADRNDGDIMREVWRGGGEQYWADVILDAVRSDERVLVHCGIHHAFTEYRQPIVIDGDFSHFDHSLRCGNHVFTELGKRTVTIFLHSPWTGSEGYGSRSQYPADGIIDAFMHSDSSYPVGFDLTEGPFGEISIGDAVYRHGYKNPKLRDFCDGWIYTKPLSEYEGVTPIANWVNESNLEHARAQSPNPSFRQASIEEFNNGIANDARIDRRFDCFR